MLFLITRQCCSLLFNRRSWQKHAYFGKSQGNHKSYMSHSAPSFTFTGSLISFSVFCNTSLNHPDHTNRGALLGPVRPADITPVRPGPGQTTQHIFLVATSLPSFTPQGVPHTPSGMSPCWLLLRCHYPHAVPHSGSRAKEAARLLAEHKEVFSLLLLGHCSC